MSSRFVPFLIALTLITGGVTLRAVEGPGRNMWGDERDLEAMANARESVRTAPQDFKGHYLVAVAHLGLEQFDAANEAAGRALALAPADAKAEVARLIERIKARRPRGSAAEEAAAALAEGRAGRAAELFEQAAGADVEFGFKAADLYAHRLGQPVDAARVLRQLRRGAGGATVARADAALAELREPLRQIARDFLAKARVANDAVEQQRLLARAQEADPDLTEIYAFDVRVAAQGGNREMLQAAIERLARQHRVTAAQLAKLPNLARWLAAPEFAAFLATVVGAGDVARLQAGNVAVELSADEAQEVAGLALKLMPIPTGTFTMGAAAGEADEVAPHAVTIDRPFWLGEHEVTQAQWQAVMGGNPSRFAGGNFPVEQVAWADCQEFCRKLTERERAAGRLPAGYAYRLPTEAEWEYACRAGATGDFAGAGGVEAYAWYRENSGNATHAVGQKHANAWGLFDMHGNVWEWCADVAAADPASGARDEGAPRRVLRGGGWFDGAAYCRASGRLAYAPGIRDGDLGFRLALSAVP